MSACDTPSQASKVAVLQNAQPATEEREKLEAPRGNRPVIYFPRQPQANKETNQQKLHITTPQLDQLHPALNLPPKRKQQGTTAATPLGKTKKAGSSQQVIPHYE